VGILRVRLVRPDGTVAGDRTISGSFPCAELAEAAALVLASWQTELRAGPIVTPAVKTAPPPARGRTAGAGPSFELGAGLTAAAAASVVPGVTVVAALAPGGGDLAGELAVGASAFRRESLAAGAVRWARVPVSLGMRQRWGQAVRIDAHAGLAGALLLVRGQGFDRNDEGSAFDVGGLAGVRVGRRWGRVTPWAGLTAAFWASASAVHDGPGQNRHDLPRFEAWLGLGATWQLSADSLQGSSRAAHAHGFATP
jgi:hypothetical protein